MPLRAYHHASRQPPSTLDHTLAHEYEVGFAVFQTLGGALGLISVLGNRFSVSQSFDRLPWPLAAVLCGLLVVGGAVTLAGIYNDDDDLMVGYRRERTGQILSGAAWLAYGIVLAYLFPTAIIGWSFSFILTCCAALRLWATFREEKRLREQGA